MTVFSSWAARVWFARRLSAADQPEQPVGEIAILGAHPPVPLHTIQPLQSDFEQAAEPEVGKQNKTPLHAWLILPLITFGAMVTLFLPSSLAVLVLLLVVLVAVVVVVRDSGFSLRNWRLSLEGIRSGNAVQVRQRRTLDFVRSHPYLLAIVFTLFAVLCLIGAAYEFRPDWEITDRSNAVLLMLLGGVWLGLALLTARYREPLLTLTDTPIQPLRSNGLVVFTGVLLLALVAAINSNLLGIQSLLVVTTHIQFILWLLGIVLMTWGLSGTPRFWSLRISREMLLLIVFAVLAFGVRMYHLDTAIRASIDEVHFIAGIREVQFTPQIPLLVPVSVHLPVTMLPLYLNNLALDAFGGPSLFSLRFTQVIAGTLNVLAVYGLCHVLFNRRMAVAATLVVIGFPLHIHFSRIGMAHMLDTLFGTLALMFIARGLKHNRRSDWALAGTSLGLTQYFFEGGRLLFPPVVILWTVVLIITQRKRLREHGRGFLVCGLAAVFTAAPVYFSVYSLDVSRASRYDESGVSGEYFSGVLAGGLDQTEIDQLLQRVTNPFQMYVNRAEMIPQYFGGDQPLVLTIFVPLFLLGVFYLLWRWRSPSFVIIIWLVGTALGNSLLHDQWQSPRFVEVTPALAICIAVGIGYTLPFLFGGERPPGRTVSTLTLAAASLVGVVMVGYYFGPHLHLFNTQFRQSKEHGDGVDAALRVVDAAYPQGTHIVVISDPQLDLNVPRDVLGFLADGEYAFDSYLSAEIDASFFEGLPRDVNYAFFVDGGGHAHYQSDRAAI